MRSESSRDSGISAPLRTFQDYIGLKLHFNDQFIWHRDFRVKQKEEQLMRRRDAFLFTKLADKEPDREKRIQRMISAFKTNRKAWIGEMFEEEYVAAHKRRMGTISALKYNFRHDIDKLVVFMEDREIDVRKLLLSDGQSPYIIRNMSDIPGEVTDETLALLERAFKFCSSQESIDPYWEEKAFMLSKYHYWLDLDKAFLKEQLSRLVPRAT